MRDDGRPERSTRRPRARRGARCRSGLGRLPRLRRSTSARSRKTGPVSSRPCGRTWTWPPGSAPTCSAARRRGTIPGGTSPPASTCPPTDGVSVPVTVVRHRDTPLDGTAPLLLYGYGAYEATDGAGLGPGPAQPAGPRGGLRPRARPWRRRGRPTLVARRPAGAQAAHVRRLRRGRRRAGRAGTSTAPGSSPAGSPPAACSRARCSASVRTGGGRSWPRSRSSTSSRRCSTPTIPLTINEWDEWGDPRRRADFDWMLAYSPYDNPPPAGGRAPTCW